MTQNGKWYRGLGLGTSLLLLVACDPAKPKSERGKAESSKLNQEEFDAQKDAETIEKETAWRRNYRPFKVSAFELDLDKFAVLGVAVGLKPFLRNESPILTYQIPRDADYVEIMRCKSNVIIPSSGSETISLETIGLSGGSAAEKAELLRQSDFFNSAREVQGCTVISSGTIDTTFQDTYAPSSGDVGYRYLLQACVARERLIDTEQTTSRNCSRQIGISREISYTNKSRDEENKALQKMQQFESQVSADLWSMRNVAEVFIQELDACGKREHKRAVDTKVKNAWLRIASSVIEVFIEIKGYTGRRTKDTSVLTHYLVPTSPGRLMDTVQLLNAAAGLTFSDMFIQLATTPKDMPRSCTTVEKLSYDMQGMVSEYYAHIANYMYWGNMSQLAAQGADISDEQSGEGGP